MSKPFSVNVSRFDPYKTYKFRVKWDGRYVAGVSKVGALKRSIEVVRHREGGDPSLERVSPGRAKIRSLASGMSPQSSLCRPPRSDIARGLATI